MNICIFGDSITWGAYDPKNGGWANSLRNSLEPDDIQLYNCGISGDTTSDLLKRFKTEADARKPKIIIFAIGINDSQYINTKDNPKVSVSDFRSNIEKLIEEAKRFTDNVIFIGLNNVNEDEVTPTPWDDKNNFYCNENIEIYNNIIKEIIEKEDLDFIDLKEVIALEDLYDGLHPNTQGHKKIFEEVKKFLKSKNLI
jgi:lysophospholipase L1-like esterase